VRKSTAIVASLVAASSLAVALRIGELSTLSAIEIPVPGPTGSSLAPTTGATSTPQVSEPGTQSPVATPPTQAPVETTLVSDVIAYKYGDIQISLTKTDGVISAVNVLIGDATNGRDEAYLILTAATIETQGTNYGNVSGATFTILCLSSIRTIFAFTL
jgi:hypothetical protein